MTSDSGNLLGSTTLSIPHIDACMFCNMLPYGDYIVIDARSKAKYDKECIVGSISCPPQDVTRELSLSWLSENAIEHSQREKFSWATVLRTIIAGDNTEDPWVRQLFLFFCEEEFRYPPEFVSVPKLKRCYPLLIAPSGEARLFYRFRYPSEIIEDFLWLGSMQSAHSNDTVVGLGITHIVNATNSLDNNKFPKTVHYFNVNVHDEESEDITSFFQPVCQFIDDALRDNGRVLVHCHAGISRSASLVINYLRHHFHWNLRQAYRHTISRRPEVHPNRSFMKQLIQEEARQSDSGDSSISESDLGRNGGLVQNGDNSRVKSTENDWRPFMTLPRDQNATSSATEESVCLVS